jgi:two-component system, OmpR family, phosphate regulon sensor histidine kinase PhoR
MGAGQSFLSIAAHELKTPLTSIAGYAQMLGRWLRDGGKNDAERLEHSVSSIVTQTEKLSRLVTQLLDVSRLQDGQLRLAPTRVDLAALAREIADAARGWSAQHAIVVDSPASLHATVDPLRLEQVVTNLLENAMKFSAQDGVIELSLRKIMTGEIQLSVRDYGIGIPTERRSRIFQRCYQAHSQDGLVCSGRSGMGIGLFVSRQIVTMHGGSISAEFPADGGTRFIVRLPSTRDDLPA